jgi:hypothetical protein
MPASATQGKWFVGFAAAGKAAHMTDLALLTAADIALMQGLAQRVTAVRPELISAGASYGELAWVWGKGRGVHGAIWPRRLWFSGTELARAMMLHGMRLARAAGATHATVVCLGAPGHPRARGLYYGVGFRELSRDAPLVKAGTAG